MKTFYCSVSALDNYLSENDADCLDAIDGSLIDSAVYSLEAGTLFCFEHYRNEWSSDYYCLFFPANHERGIDKAWARWYALRAETESMIYA